MCATRQLFILSLVFLTYACSSEIGQILPDRKVDYQKQPVAESDIEVPPDLIKDSIKDAMPVPGVGSNPTYSQYQSSRGGSLRLVESKDVLPDVANIKIMRDGNQRWLEIKSDPEQVWQKTLAFWRENGILLVEQKPALGIMKTDWLENRADIKQGFLTDFLRKTLDSLYTAATRDQFRVRLEPGTNAGTTELYLTHRGLEEQFVTTASGDKENSLWVPRPNDPGLEAEMLRRIMLYMGAKEQAATSLAQTQEQQVPHAAMEKLADGSSTLLVKAGMDVAWRLVGLGIERVGFAVEERDRTKGSYSVRYDDPTKKDDEGDGFFHRLAFWRDSKKPDDNLHRLHLEAAGNDTRVMVLDNQGQPDQSDTGMRILTLLQEQIH